MIPAMLATATFRHIISKFGGGLFSQKSGDFMKRESAPIFNLRLPTNFLAVFILFFLFLTWHSVHNHYCKGGPR